MAGRSEDELLERIQALTQQTPDGTRWIDVSIDPIAAEEVGAAIAMRAAEYDPQIIVTWMGPDDSVLAHIVARNLGISSVRAELDMGLITIDRELPPSRRILLLTTIDDPYRRLNSLGTLLVADGHTIVAAASVLSIGTPLIDSDTPQLLLS